MIKIMFLTKTKKLPKKSVPPKRPIHILCLDFSHFMLTLDVRL